MKYKIYCVFLVFLTLTILSAEVKSKEKPAYFYGHISSNLDTIRLKVGFYRDHITGGGKELQQFDVSVDKDGEFHFVLPEMQHIGRFFIVDAFSNNALFPEYQIVEPGDSIYIEAAIHDQSNMSDSNFMANFRGIGASKYNCIQALKSCKDNVGSLPWNTDIKSAIIGYDVLLAKKMATLNMFSSGMSPIVYEILKTDIAATLGTQALYSICGYEYSGIFSADISLTELNRRKDAFDRFIMHINHASASGNILILSSDYPRFLLEQTKCKLTFKNRGTNFGFKEMYEELKAKYNGLLREKVLAFYLLSDDQLAGFFGGCTPDDYTYCLKDALRIIKTNWLALPVNHLLNTRGKGAVAFNFTLPADSSGHKVSLSDLKGKVQLIDIWSYRCTGCTLFSQVFHKKIFPLFKDNPNFKVVSIMVGDTDKERYMFRLRRKADAFGEQYATYTYTDYINLFGGRGEPGGDALQKHYNIIAFPFLLLIDKNGNIYSSTIPFFTEQNSPNVEKLVQLIKNALAGS